jgi:hypothetical protein
MTTPEKSNENIPPAEEHDDYDPFLRRREVQSKVIKKILAEITMPLKPEITLTLETETYEFPDEPDEDPKNDETK